MNESDLFEPVKHWLEEKEYEVFSEVTLKYGRGRADIVARRSPAIAVVELKTTLSLELLEQAYRWKSHAHYIYVAIPRRKKSVPKIITDFFRKEKIGLLEVSLFRTGGNIYEMIPARFNRPFLNNIDWSKELLPEHKTFLPGGSAGGGYVTPYKLTINRVKEFLRRRFEWNRNGWDPEGWVTITQILDECETHYAAPKNSLAKALIDFENSWCETKKEKGRLYFRYKNELGEK
jgi:hypothetical protein